MLNNSLQAPQLGCTSCDPHLNAYWTPQAVRVYPGKNLETV